MSSERDTEVFVGVVGRADDDEAVAYASDALCEQIRQLVTAEYPGLDVERVTTAYGNALAQNRFTEVTLGSLHQIAREQAGLLTVPYCAASLLPWGGTA